ncbi:MAG: bifunctional rhamnulose-1-phosphate aldolase/short-chain dehydrogenase [Luteolibacter sp.]
MNQPLKHLTRHWNDTEPLVANSLDELVYRSNCLGADQRITNTGGGNTSSKILETDPLTGKPVEVLWVKGSGGDLRTAKRENFASLELSKLMELQQLYASRSDRGLKSRAEDDMVAMFSHATFNLNPRPASIDTPLHGFIPHPHVDHTHPNAVIAVAACANSKDVTREIFGDEVIHLPWMRPGFELGLAMQEACKTNPQANGFLMGQHGLINWGPTGRECYEKSLELIEKAACYIEQKQAVRGGEAKLFGGPQCESLPDEKRQQVFAALLPWLRGQISSKKRFVATIQDDHSVMRFVNSADAPRLAELGTSCPDHFLRTKIKPLFIPHVYDPNSSAEEIADALKSSLAEGLAQYRLDYSHYYEQCKRPDSPAMRDPNPTVILVAGLGMIAFGKDKSESRVTAEFYHCAIEVMRGAEALGGYIALPQQEAFDIEYWALEEAKLRRMPADKELAGRVAVVIGAGSGIGRVTAQRLSRDGAHVACVDLNLEAAEETAKSIQKTAGMGIGVAGSGISKCGPAIALQADITQRESIRRMLDQVILAYGGYDAIAVTAGIFIPSDNSGHIRDDQWTLTFNVNVTGSYLVVDEAAKDLRQQGLAASVVLTTSANAVVAKKGSLAYDTSKAAANHLVRELAIEMAPQIRVNGVAPATVVQDSGMFPRDRVISSLNKYGIPFKDDDSDETLVSKLAQFYADRTLTNAPITPADQAEAYFLLISERLSKTTGQIISVDGGLHEAFLR